jgi:hypothetical protein
VTDAANRITIDPTLYKLHSAKASGGSAACRHDWTDKGELPGYWRCILCGRVTIYEAWA